MELTETYNDINWLSAAFAENQANLNPDLPISKLKNRAFESFQKLGFPSMKHEEWKYTFLKKGINIDAYIDLNLKNLHLDYQIFKQYSLNQNSKYKIYIIDGIFIPSISATSQANVFEINSIYQECNNPNSNLQEKYGSSIDINIDSLACFNLAFSSDGFYLKIFKNQYLADNIEIIEIITENAPEVLQPNYFIDIENDSEVTITHSIINQNTNKVFYNSLFQIHIGINSICNFTSLQDLSNDFYLIENKFVVQKDKSNFINNQIALSGELIRNNLSVKHEGQFIETHMNGLVCLNGAHHVDNHTLMDHATPNCYSNEVYRNILNGKSHGVFNGKIIVRPDAQKTNAFQSNKNILVSDEAVLNAKPQLEIFADDVKCSHGCTSAQLEDKQLFYLESRGINKATGTLMLIFAFAIETLNGIKDKTIRTIIEQKIANSLKIEI